MWSLSFPETCARRKQTSECTEKRKYLKTQKESKSIETPRNIERLSGGGKGMTLQHLRTETFQTRMWKDLIRIIIIEDHTIIRESIEANFNNRNDMTVVGSWSNAEDALLFLRNGDADVAIVDNMLPGMDGTTFITQALQLRPELKVIILSMHTHESLICQAFDNGAYGFLPKDAYMNELLDAIRTVARGEYVLYPKLTKRLIDYKSQKRNGSSVHSLLTDDQKKILIMTAEGMGNKEISAKMGCSVSTVKHNYTEILNRLEARDRTHAVVKAIQAGIIEINPSFPSCESPEPTAQNV